MGFGPDKYITNKIYVSLVDVQVGYCIYLDRPLLKTQSSCHLCGGHRHNLHSRFLLSFKIHKRPLKSHKVYA